MDVFLVPVAPDRYELYCEEPDEPEPPEQEGAPAPGFFRRLVLRFRDQLAEAERARHLGPQPGDVRPSFLGRAKNRTLRWVVESIAEQRLLWQLRGKDAVLLVFPDDLTDPQARQLLMRSLQRDWDRHRFWLVVDTLGGLGSIALIILPGPNFIGYYFMFRIVGHYFSLRGARQGMNRRDLDHGSQRPAVAAPDAGRRSARGPRRARARRRRLAQARAPRQLLSARSDAQPLNAYLVYSRQ